nr:transcription factor bHLH35-like [Tanacetum cinerariifolium]
MDKASIIKDAIDYIQTLHDQEKTIQAELMELESRKLEPKTLEFNQEAKFLSMERSKKFRVEQAFDSSGSSWYPIEVRDVSS